MKTMERQRSMTLVMMIDSEFEGNGIDDMMGAIMAPMIVADMQASSRVS